MKIVDSVFAAVLAALAFTRPIAAQHVHTDPAAEHDHAAMVGDTAGLGRQLDEVRAATARYQTHATAVADGYKLFGAETPLMGEHWYLPGQVQKPLDLAHPSTLQYATIDGKRQLVGVAYTLYRRPTDPMPEGFAGALDDWHVHDLTKLARAITEDRPLVRMLTNLRIARGKVGGGDGKTLLTMVHAWPQLENPDGPFAQMHRSLPYLRAGLPASFANGADEDAAWGVSLLAPGACAAEIRRVDGLAHLTGSQRSRLGAACVAAEAQVTAVPDRSSSSERLNAAAAAAWKGYVQARDSLLTVEQKARMDSAVEHEMMGPGMGGNSR